MAKNNRPKQNKTLNEPKTAKQTEEQDFDSAYGRKGNVIEPYRSILICCEGQTEAAYINGIIDFFSLKIAKKNILPLKENNENYKNSSVKGLLYEAMKKMKAESFDEVWIILDNDEHNSYKLDKKTFEAIKKLSLPNYILTELKRKQIRVLDADVKEGKEEDNNRERYFLHLKEYEDFLKKEILDVQDFHYIDSIIGATIKKEDLYKLWHDRKSFFYDTSNKFTKEDNFDKSYFSENNLSKIKVAYSSIAFEYWLLLHFEQNKTAFYNSQEIVTYLQRKQYFLTNENKENNYYKGWWLFDNKDKITDFWNLAKEKATINNLVVFATYCLPEKQKKSIHDYEINPYSDIFYLLQSLLNNENWHIKPLNENINCAAIFDFIVNINANVITIKGKNLTRTPIKLSNLKDAFSLYDQDNNLIQTNFESANDTIIRQNEAVEIKLSFENINRTLHFLHFHTKIINLNKNDKFIWLLN